MMFILLFVYEIITFMNQKCTMECCTSNNLLMC